jgi:hypothetical protein
MFFSKRYIKAMQKYWKKIGAHEGPKSIEKNRGHMKVPKVLKK